MGNNTLPIPLDIPNVKVLDVKFVGDEIHIRVESMGGSTTCRQCGTQRGGAWRILALADRGVYLASESSLPILQRRQALYQAAKASHPERWSGPLRNWEPVKIVYLNPGKPMKKEADLKQNIS